MYFPCRCAGLVLPTSQASLLVWEGCSRLSRVCGRLVLLSTWSAQALQVRADSGRSYRVKEHTSYRVFRADFESALSILAQTIQKNEKGPLIPQRPFCFAVPNICTGDREAVTLARAEASSASRHCLPHLRDSSRCPSSGAAWGPGTTCPY